MPHWWFEQANRSVLPLEEPVNARSYLLDVRDQVPPYEPIPVLHAPARAPNVLLILLDDMGFGASSAFGGPCRMPIADGLAGNGLRFSRFHTTALCAPTRAALLTGRNHHTCGMGSIPEFSTAAPGYSSVRPRSVATIARILSLNGFATGAFGKMHQTPAWEISPTGPFDRWPTGEGFERFYGFLGGETNQFAPNLIDGITPVNPPRKTDQGYHLSEDLVDQAIAWISSLQTVDPARRWFCYLSFAATHSPIHVPERWRDVYLGQFAHGWDEQRERTLARQKEMGLIPSDAKLGPWPTGVPRWAELSATQQQVSARLMELYAAFAEHTDVQVGRLIGSLEEAAAIDDTLILYILGDNGAAAECGINGTINASMSYNDVEDTFENMEAHLADVGGPFSYPHYPVGWALAMNAPYQWTKHVASHYGGTRNGLIVQWPSGMTSRGEIRHQWHHVIDIVPTILEVADIPQPTSVDGVRQHAIEGVSLAYTFDAPDASGQRRTQYFEIYGNRGIYVDGWTAVAKHRAPWQKRSETPAFRDDVWELYDTNSDWTQARDVAGEFPEKLVELREYFAMVAAEHDVFPLEDRRLELLDPHFSGRPNRMGGRRSVVLRPGMPGLSEDVAPNLKNTSFVIVAWAEISEAPARGVIISQGGRFGGWSFYCAGGILSYCHNLYGRKQMFVRAREPLATGSHRLELRFSYDGGGLGAGGAVTISADEDVIGSGRIEETTPVKYSFAETLDVGLDRFTPVVEDYGEAPGNAFNGAIDAVYIVLGRDGIAIPVAQSVRAALRSH